MLPMSIAFDMLNDRVQFDNLNMIIKCYLNLQYSKYSILLLYEKILIIYCHGNISLPLKHSALREKIITSTKHFLIRKMGNKNSRTQLPPNTKIIQNSGYINAPGMYYFKPGMVPIPRSSTSPLSTVKVSALHQSMHCLNNPEPISYKTDGNKLSSRLSLNELGNGKIPPGYVVVQGPPIDVKSYKKWQKAHKKMLKKMSSSGDTIIPYPPGPVMPVLMPGMIPFNDVKRKNEGRATSLDNLTHSNVEMSEHLPRSGRFNDKKKIGTKKMYRKSFHYEERNHNATSSIDYHGGTSRVSSSQSNLHNGTLSDYHNKNDYDGEDTSSGIVCTSESSENHSTSNQHDNGTRIKRVVKSCRSSNSEHHRTGENTSLNTTFEHPLPPLNIIKKSKNINDNGVREIPIQRLSNNMYSDIPKDGFNTQSSVSSINFTLSNINHKNNRTSTPYKSKTFSAPTPPQKLIIDERNSYNDTTSDSLFDGSTSRPSISSSKDMYNNSRETLSNRSINPSLKTINSTTNYSHTRSEVSDVDFSWIKDIENRLDKEIFCANKNFLSKPLPDLKKRNSNVDFDNNKQLSKNEKSIPVKYFGIDDNFNKDNDTKNDTDYLVNVSQKSPNEDELLAIHSNVKSKAAMFDLEASKNNFLAKKERDSTEYLLKSKHKPPPSYEEHKAKQHNHLNLPFIPKPDYPIQSYGNDDQNESYYSKIKPPQIKDIKKINNQPQKYIRYQQNPNRLSSTNTKNNMLSSNIERISKIEDNIIQHPWRSSLAFSS
uniref:SoHo domain-containing protein n=2 Tax=Strongyloides stercoralis TaxID=6248 RepID=A0AAF5I341_STRER